MNSDNKIYIAGHNGMVGSAIYRHLHQRGYSKLIVRSSSDLDLRNKTEVDNFFEQAQPEYVFLAAAKVGGIEANYKYPAQFIHDNLAIASNVIHAAYKYKAEKLLFLGSSCIYPKFSKQPIKEEEFLTGKLESTNSAYAIAKIAGIEMCKAYRREYGCNFISCMPCNLYGPNDNYDHTNSHVLAALIRKVHEAKLQNANTIRVWGTGQPRREFLHADDLAEACFFLMNEYDEEDIINVGSGSDISITELALLIAEVMEHKIHLEYDHTKFDGTPRKLLDISKIKQLGWRPKIDLRSGIESVYKQIQHSGFLL
jgi:GDP-L-fucose synthase